MSDAVLPHGDVVGVDSTVVCLPVLIMVLPPEILCVIFSLILWRDWRARRSDSDSFYRAFLNARKSLMHVSSRWRAVVEGTPSFWSDIRVEPCLHPALLEDWVRNCDSVPVTATINLPDSSRDHLLSVFETISRVLSRFTWMEIHADFTQTAERLLAMLHTTPLSQLEIIIFKNSASSPMIPAPGHQIQCSSAPPLLRYIRLSRVVFNLPQHINLHNLRVLSIHNCSLESSPTWDDYRAVCSYAPLLERLSIRLVSCRGLPSVKTDTFFPPLLWLQDLVVAFPDDNSFASVLSHMQLPSLKSFVLSLASNYHLRELAGCGRALSTVVHLHYTGLPVSSGDLSDFLAVMPSIQDMVVTLSHRAMLEALNLPGGSHVQCPALRSLAVPCSPKTFRSFFEQRMVHNKYLERVYFARRSRDWKQYREDLDWLHSQGRLEVSIVSGFILPSWIILD